ncbi:hypothetical protein PENSPDRAFT_668771 [Peniophora sp. CONT]|nr:hypothetical protein PENSPDRAFT_668771 [Peniophora sp. CONT]
MIINIDTRILSGTGQDLPPTLANIGTSEVALLELQGQLEVEGNQSGQVAGKLTLDPEGKNHAERTGVQRKPTLRVGHHLLEGKIVNLSKPLAVLEKQSRESDDLEETTQNTSRTPPSYAIRAIVRKKLVFSKRPMPMVTAGITLAASDAAAKRS